MFMFVETQSQMLLHHYCILSLFYKIAVEQYVTSAKDPHILNASHIFSADMPVISLQLFYSVPKQDNFHIKIILPFLYEYTHIKKEVSLPHPVY
jgi:hypothetical protein